MCRITGFWNISKKQSFNEEQIIQKMRDTMAHGGPDAANLYVNAEDNVALGHRRLSILDTSDAGTQPMYWNDYVIIYNGEIYNFQEIKELLPEYTFKTGTDSEVILKAFEKWGFDAVQHFRGMFAFAIWDKKLKKLTLCRDRVGVKPMYWYWKDGLFMFASELKAFHQHPQFDKTLNHKAVSLFLQQGYIQSPHCIFKHAHKLESGHFLEINAKGDINKFCFWDLKEIYENNELNTKSEGEVTEELEDILKTSFKYRMVSDVPVGMFLSGGIDSSLVTAMLQKEYNTPLKTFTIGFHDKKANEATFAKEVAKHIGTEHEELYCSEEHFKELIPKLPQLYDEPMGNGSAIPVYLVSQLAKDKVKVSLSADGGDEIFGGYSKYEILRNHYKKIATIPNGIKKLMGKGIQSLSPQLIDSYASYLPGLKNYSNLGTKVYKFSHALAAKNELDFYNVSSSYISKKALLKLFPFVEDRLQLDTAIRKDQLLSYLGIADMKSFMEGEVLTTVDRATMGVALEGREPFLDQHIIEFGLGLPDNLKIRGNETKYILRKILYKYVPKELIERPKHGFDIPIKKWTQTFLKADILGMADDQDFLATFLFDRENFQKSIKGYFAGQSELESHFVWFLFVLYKWYQTWMKN